MSKQYKLKQYNPGAWCIMELKTTPEINERTGQQNRNPGSEWVAIKYPGNLEQAAARLLSLVVGTDEELTTKELIEAVRSSEAAITHSIAEFVEVWK